MAVVVVAMSSWMVDRDDFYDRRPIFMIGEHERTNLKLPYMTVAELMIDTLLRIFK